MALGLLHPAAAAVEKNEVKLLLLIQQMYELYVNAADIQTTVAYLEVLCHAFLAASDFQQLPVQLNIP